LTLVSIVVPVLDDLDAARALLLQLQADGRAEIVLVDGGFDAGLDALVVSRPDVRLVRSAPGRGRQMNTGAALASGAWLLFLHSDSRLPEDWLTFIAQIPPGVGGGWFRFGLDDPAWQARAVECGVAWRVRTLRLPYGDQGLFVRRRVFDQLGGFSDLPLMEDVEFVRRLVRAVPTVEIPATLLTSARRWRRDGWARRSVRNLMLITLYFAGVPAARLAQWYGQNPTPVPDDAPFRRPPAS
jgi:rSAM/selenodomain-associated transferase 2